MKEVGALGTAVVFIGWAMWNLWSLFRIATGLRDRSWQRPLWWTRVGSVALFAGLTTWTWALFSTGLDVSDTCQFVHHEYYDSTYTGAHAAEFRKLFPLHNKCNAHFDLVPPWVNPFLVVCTVVVVAAVAVLLRFGITHLTGLPGRWFRQRSGGSRLVGHLPRLPLDQGDGGSVGGCGRGASASVNHGPTAPRTADSPRPPADRSAP
ncbi:hypothetical protein [Streptomyces sp. NPDC047000]|uniref:hypothetical protein n=1 Tax=Streptomyces sp. NPDC047000 TaxID=3155474 RepID=UPI0033D60C2C